MPHFYAATIDEISYPRKMGDFEFVLEAVCVDSSENPQRIILVKRGAERFFLMRQSKNGKILVKFNKNLKCASISTIKVALGAFATLTNATIISHNLHTKITRPSAKCEYLLGIDSVSHVHFSRIEIGFGSGAHLIALARQNPSERILGVEIYRPAITKILRQIALCGLKNLFVIYADSRDLLEILPQNSVSAIYLHFPVPWEDSPQRRVFSEGFFAQAMSALKERGFLELRSDSAEYVAYALKIARNAPNVAIEEGDKCEVISKYEARWRRENKEIFNVRFIKTDSRVICSGNISHFKLESLDMSKILALRKIHNEEYLVHIRNIYEFDEGYVLLLVFGAFRCLAKVYLVVTKNGVEIIGDFAPSRVNLAALRKFSEIYGGAR